MKRKLVVLKQKPVVLKQKLVAAGRHSGLLCKLTAHSRKHIPGRPSKGGKIRRERGQVMKQSPLQQLERKVTCSTISRTSQTKSFIRGPRDISEHLVLCVRNSPEDRQVVPTATTGAYPAIASWGGRAGRLEGAALRGRLP